MSRTSALLGAVMLIGPLAMPASAATDWRIVEQIIGRPGAAISRSRRARRPHAPRTTVVETLVLTETIHSGRASAGGATAPEFVNYCLGWADGHYGGE